MLISSLNYQKMPMSHLMKKILFIKLSDICLFFLKKKKKIVVFRFLFLFLFLVLNLFFVYSMLFFFLSFEFIRTFLSY
jgi:hypothetical protein